MERSIENVRKTLDEVKEFITAYPSFENIAEGNSKLDKVCPRVNDVSDEELKVLHDMMFEWNMFSIKMQQFLNGVVSEDD